MSKMQYNVEIKKEDDTYIVTFPDFGWGVTQGDTREEALENAKDCLGEMIAELINSNEKLPKPRDIKNSIKVSPRSDISTDN